MKTIKKTKAAVVAKKVIPAKKATNANDGIAKTDIALITSPIWNIWDSGKHYKVRVSIPGLSKKDIKVFVNGANLIISSEKENEQQKEGKNYIVRQYNFNSWSKSIVLPQEVKAKSVKMDYKDGVLKLGLQKLTSKVA